MRWNAAPLQESLLEGPLTNSYITFAKLVWHSHQPPSIAYWCTSNSNVAWIQITPIMRRISIFNQITVPFGPSFLRSDTNVTIELQAHASCLKAGLKMKYANFRTEAAASMPQASSADRIWGDMFFPAIISFTATLKTSDTHGKYLHIIQIISCGNVDGKATVSWILKICWIL